jgi:hypothetical protein
VHFRPPIDNFVDPAGLDRRANGRVEAQIPESPMTKMQSTSRSDPRTDGGSTNENGARARENGLESMAAWKRRPLKYWAMLPVTVVITGRCCFRGCRAFRELTFADEATLSQFHRYAFAPCALAQLTLPATKVFVHERVSDRVLSIRTPEVVNQDF